MRKYRPWIYLPPENVSRQHFWLQHLARVYLWRNHYCSCVGTEVALPMLPAYHDGSPEGRENRKYDLAYERIDVMAVGPRFYLAGRPLAEQSRRLVTVGIEVKVSRSDFLSGFHQDCCTYNYVLAPAGMIKKTEMPPGVGLISADKDGWAIRIVRRAPEVEEPAFSLDTALFAIGQALTSEYAHRMRNTSVSRVTWPLDPRLPELP